MTLEDESVGVVWKMSVSQGECNHRTLEQKLYWAK